jgi:hypothetical protein
LALKGERGCVSEHRCGDVGEQNAQRGTHTLNGTERDDTFPGTDVRKLHPWSDMRRVNHTIGDTFHVDAYDFGESRIIAVSAMQ